MSKSNSTSDRALNLVQTFTDAGFPVTSVSVEGRKITLEFSSPSLIGASSVDAELRELEESVDLLQVMRDRRAARNSKTSTT